MDLSALNIGIVGLGLMGGSLALALKGTVGKIVGIDRDDETRARAMRQGVVSEATQRLQDVVSDVDLIVLAVPVESIVLMVQELPEIWPDGCALMDLGSTKSEIGRVMSQLPGQFAAIGGHPMCGREHSGLAAATADLYQGQTFVLCRNERTTAEMERVATAIVAQIGSRPMFMQPETHDNLVATSSHLPYIVASTLMGRAWSQAEEDERLWQVSASGLRDTTRLAGSGPQMMLEILMTNSEPIVGQLEAYGRELEVLADLLRRGDREALRNLLEAAQMQRLQYMNHKYDLDAQ